MCEFVFKKPYKTVVEYSKSFKKIKFKKKNNNNSIVSLSCFLKENIIFIAIKLIWFQMKNSYMTDVVRKPENPPAMASWTGVSCSPEKKV